MCRAQWLWRRPVTTTSLLLLLLPLGSYLCVEAQEAEQGGPQVVRRRVPAQRLGLPPPVLQVAHQHQLHQERARAPVVRLVELPLGLMDE